MKFLKIFLLTTLLAAGASAQEEPGKNLISCWNHMFDYTRFDVKELKDNPRFLEITFSSQTQSKVLGNFPLTTPNGWGQASIFLLAYKEACMFDEKSNLLVRCDLKEGNVVVSYDEDIEEENIRSRKILRMFGETHLKIERTPEGLTASLDFTLPSGKKSSTALSFDLKHFSSDEQCR